MNVSLKRLLTITAAVRIVSLVVAGTVKHAKHGFALYLGDVAWFTFLIGVLVTIALALALRAKVVRHRHAERVEVR